jgi:hypothetical protein
VEHEDDVEAALGGVAMSRWKCGRASEFRQPECMSEYSPTTSRPFSSAKRRTAWRCASGEKPCPCSSVDSRMYATARGLAVGAVGEEPVSSPQPPVGEPAGERLAVVVGERVR